MALSRFNSRVLAQAHMASKNRRRRLVLLSSRHLQPSSLRMRPSKHSLSDPSRTTKPPPDMSTITKDRLPKTGISFKLPPNKSKTTLTASSTSVKFSLDPSAIHPDASPKKKKYPTLLGEDQHQGDTNSSLSDHHPLHHDHDSIGASVQRLQIPHVPTSSSDDAAASQLVPCKSMAKRKLDELLKNPINFVPATQATTDTEPVPKRRRLKNEDMIKRSRAISHLPRKFPRPDLDATGMINSNGAVCYRRSIYQVLMNLPIFVNWIKLHDVDPHYPCRPTAKGCVACALCKLANAYWPAGDARRNGSAVQKAVNELDKIMNRHGCPGSARHGQNAFYAHQDAHEFLLSLFQHLAAAQPEVRDEFDALFGIKRERRRNCTRCGHKADPNDPTVSECLQVNLRDPKKGLGFKEYFDRAFFEVNNLVVCPTCRKRAVHVWKDSVLDGPEILTIQLVRFAMDFGAVSSRPRKVGDAVPLPLHLDLSEYFEDAEMRRPGTLRYRLAGVVQHLGQLSGGHYTAKVVSPAGIQLADDESVSKRLPVKELVQATDGGFTPYILMYTKVRE